MTAGPLALYTTVYPQVLPYLREWFASVLAQEDGAFELWIGLDGLAPGEVAECLRGPFPIHWCPGQPGDSPTAVRARAIAAMVDQAAAVVFTDSDDLLAPTRVAAARAALADADAVACALRLVDVAARDLGITLAPPPDVDAATMLPSRNLFGLSNTAYRTTLLRCCLPLPAAAPFADWYLVTRAWGLGARLAFDPEPRMAYRQHGENIARVLPPFDAAEVLRAARLVLRHYDTLATDAPGTPAFDPHRRDMLLAVRDRVRAFLAAMEATPAGLSRYVQALNRLEPEHVWWWHVAHPDLETTWNHSN